MRSKFTSSVASSLLLISIENVENPARSAKPTAIEGLPNRVA